MGKCFEFEQRKSSLRENETFVNFADRHLWYAYRRPRRPKVPRRRRLGELCWSRGPRLLGRYLSSGSGDGRVRRHSPRVGRARRNPPVQIETPRIPDKITFLQTQLFKVLF